MDNDLHKIYQDFFNSLLGYEPDMEIVDDEQEVGISLKLSPEDSGMFIGYRGEVLTAIQLILSLIYQKHSSSWKPVRMNVNDYRQRREATLISMADNAAMRALESGEPTTITNLTSYERRIIHSHLSQRDDVTTHSEGESPKRYLVISPKN